ncbi:integumentary mucin C.1-like [Argopecten irradians]|uniref:integumentary mucin C.1-like n=1 Tax=Argopecten irradians TaxID=31199 RepID=UPI003724C26D
MRNSTRRLLVIAIVLGLSSHLYSLCIPQCLNGGSCVNSTCTCMPGFTGEYCQNVATTTTTATTTPTSTEKAATTTRTSTTTTTTTPTTTKKGHC